MPEAQNITKLPLGATGQRVALVALFLCSFISVISAQEGYSARAKLGEEPVKQPDTPEPVDLEAINSRMARLETETESLKDHTEIKAYLKSASRNIDLGYQSLSAVQSTLTIVIAIVAILVAVVFGILPFYLSKHLKEEARRAADDARLARESALNAEKEAKEYLNEIKQLAKEAGHRAAELEDLAKKFADKPFGPAEKQTLEDVLKDVRSSDREKLLANALNAQNDKKWDDAVAYWKSLIVLNPGNAETYFGLGVALSNQARLKGEEVLFREANKNYAETLRMNPDYYGAYNNWGSSLAALAKMKREETVFRMSFKKYAEAIRIKPDYYGAYNNWGLSLTNLARLKGDEKLFQEAFEKYAEAVRIDPDTDEAYQYWGNALLLLATLTGVNKFLMEASEKLLKAEEIKKGSGAYDLACIASLRNEFEECRSWLEKSKETGNLPNLKELQEDTDLDNVRNEDWFKEFLSKLDNEQ